MSREQDFAPFESQVRNQYEIWMLNVLTGSWCPLDDTFDDLPTAELDIVFWRSRKFTVKLVTVQYTIIDVQ